MYPAEEERPSSARGPGTEADLTSVVARLEAHFAQSLLTLKPKKKQGQGLDEATNTSKSDEFETLNALETALYRAPKESLLSLQPQIEKLLLKKCLPLSGSLALRELISQCIVGVFFHGNKATLSSVYYELQTTCLKASQHFEIQLVSMHCLGNLVEAYPKQLGSNKYFLDSLEAIMRQVKTNEASLREVSLMTLIKVAQVAAQHQIYLKFRQFDEIQKLLIKCFSESSNAIRKFVADLLPHLYKLTSAATDFDFFVDLAFKGLGDKEPPVRYAFAISLGRLIAAALTKPAVPKVNSNVEDFMDVFRPPTKSQYDVKDIRSGLEILQSFFVKNIRKEIWLTGRPSVTSSSAAQADFKEKSQRVIAAALAVSTIEFISKVGPLNIIYPPSSGLLATDPAPIAPTKNLFKKAPVAATVIKPPASLITLVQLLKEDVSEKEGSVDKQLKAEKTAMLIAHMIRSALTNAVPHLSQEALADQLIKIVFAEDVELSVSQRSACLIEIAHLVKILGFDSVRSLENKLNGKSMQVFLCSVDPLVRFSAMDVLRQFAIAIPHLTAKILRDLHSNAAVYISQATAPELSGNDKIKVLSSFHGHVHALAAVIRVIPRLSNGVPWDFLGELFSTSKVLLGVFRECRVELKGGIPLEAAKNICESGWVLLDSLINLGIEWAGTKLRQLFILWKDVLGAKLQPSHYSESVELVLELHSRTMAISCLLSFVELFSDKVCSEAVLLKPILSFLGNGVGFVNVLNKSDTWQNIVTTTPSIGTQLMHFESALLDCYAHLPPLSYQSRFVPLLHMAVGQLTGKHCWRTTLLEDLLDHQLHEQALLNPFKFSTTVREVCEAPIIDEDNDMPRKRLFGIVALKFLHKWKNDSFQHLPGEVRVIDAAARFFSHVYPYQTSHHQHQLAEHFFTLTQQIITKGKRFYNALCNIGVTMLMSMGKMIQASIPFGSISDVVGGDDAGNVEMAVKAILEIGMDLIRADEVLIRHSGGEILGCLCRIQGDSFTKHLLHRCRQEFQETNVESLSGYCIILSSIHRRIGALPSMKYIGFTVSTLEALSDSTAEQLRPWVLHCLWTIMRVSGLSFSSHFDQALKILMKQVVMDVEVEARFNHPLIDLHYARLILTILESFGPELIEDSVRLNQCLSVWNHIRTGTGVFDVSLHVRSQIIESTQQLIIWNSNSFKLDLSVMAEIFLGEMSVVGESNDVLVSWIRCLRQWAQKHPAFILESNLDYVLFKFLDAIPMSYEVPHIRKEILLTLDAFIENLGKTHPTRFFYLAEDVIVHLKLPSPRFVELEGKPMDEFDEKEETGENSPRADMSDEKVAIEETVRPHSKVVALYSLIQVLNLLKQDPNNPHLKLPTGIVARDLLGLHIHKIIKLMCRACNASDPELMIKGMQGLEVVYECFHRVEDEDSADKNQRYLQLYQAEITAAIRSVFSSEGAPGVRVIACRILPRLIKSGLIPDEALLRRLLSSLIKPLEPEQEIVKSWENSFDSSTTSRLMLLHLASLARVLSPFFGKNREFFSEDEIEVELPPMIIRDILSEHFDLIRQKVFDAAEDFAIICTTSPRLLRKFRGKLFEGAEVGVVTPVFASQIGYFLRTATLLLEQYVYDKINSGKEHEIDARHLFKNKMILVALAIHYVDVYFEKGNSLHEDPKRAPLPSPKIVARWSLQCLVYLLAQTIPVIPAEDQVKLAQDVLNCLVKGLRSQKMDIFLQKSILQTISALVQIMEKIPTDWPPSLPAKICALLVSIMNSQDSFDDCASKVYLENLAEAVVTMYRFADFLVKYQSQGKTLDPYGSPDSLVLLIANVLRVTALKSKEAKAAETALAGLSKICSLSDMNPYTKSIAVTLLEDLGNAENASKLKGILDTVTKLVFILGEDKYLQQKLLDQMIHFLVEGSARSKVAVFSSAQILIHIHSSKTFEEGERIRTAIGKLFPHLIKASANTGFAEAEEAMKILMLFHGVISNEQEKILFEGVLLNFFLRNLIPSNIESASFEQQYAADFALQGILKLTQALGVRFKDLFGSMESELQSRFEFALRELNISNEKKAAEAKALQERKSTKPKVGKSKKKAFRKTFDDQD